MTDILIRDVPDEVVAAIDARADPGYRRPGCRSPYAASRSRPAPGALHPQGSHWVAVISWRWTSTSNASVREAMAMYSALSRDGS